MKIDEPVGRIAKLAAIGAAVLLLPGCADIGGGGLMNFAPPDTSAGGMKPPVTYTAQKVDGTLKVVGVALDCGQPQADINATLRCSTYLSRLYMARGKDLANGQQVFDLPMIFLGTSALSAAVFDKKPEIVKRSAVAIVGLTALRTYYNAGPRLLKLQAAGQALSCVRSSAAPLAALDATATPRWLAMRDSTSFYSPTTAASALKYGSLVAAAPMAIEGAVQKIQDKLSASWGSPNLPDFGSFQTDYAAMAKKLGDAAVQAQVTAATAAATTPDTARVASFNTAFAGSQPGALLSEPEALQLLQQQGILEGLDGLQTKLDQCVSAM